MLPQFSGSGGGAAPDSSGVFPNPSHSLAITSAEILETTDVFRRILDFGDLRFL